MMRKREADKMQHVKLRHALTEVNKTQTDFSSPAKEMIAKVKINHLTDAKRV